MNLGFCIWDMPVFVLLIVVVLVAYTKINKLKKKENELQEQLDAAKSKASEEKTEK